MNFSRLSSVLPAALVLFGTAQLAGAQSDPIRIGAIYIFSGVASAYGEFARAGAELAVDEINIAGGILGRRVEIIFEDSRADPGVAIRAARALVERDKVDVLMGLDSSTVAREIVPLIPELGKPFIITHAATPDVTGVLCNKYVFRVSVNINQNLKAAALLASVLGGQRWTTIGPDYSFGHQSWEFFQKYLSEVESDIVFMDQVAFPKFGAKDFTPFIKDIMAAKPDGILVTLWGGDLVNFIRQANALGFFDKGFRVLLTLGAATEVLYELGQEMPTGIWVGTRYWFATSGEPANKAFVRAYRLRHGRYPSYNAQFAYVAVHAYKAAIEKAGSTDPDAIIAALSGLTMEAPIGTLTLRAEDHQATVAPTWGMTRFEPTLSIRVLSPIHPFTSSDVTPLPSETGCQMQ